MDENICPHLTTVDTTLNGFFYRPWKCKFQKQFTRTGFYGAVTIFNFFFFLIVWWEKKSTRDIKIWFTCGHFLLNFRFILDDVESGMGRGNCSQLTVFIRKRLRKSFLKASCNEKVQGSYYPAVISQHINMWLFLLWINLYKPNF